MQATIGNRLPYDPVLHPNHKKPWTASDLEYLCKYYELDGMRYMSYALGRTEGTITEQIKRLKQSGKFEYYKNLNKYW